jgi:hypothetical protein
MIAGEDAVRRWASFAGRPSLTPRWRIAVVSAAVEPGPVPVASAKHIRLCPPKAQKGKTSLPTMT